MWDRKREHWQTERTEERYSGMDKAVKRWGHWDAVLCREVREEK